MREGRLTDNSNLDFVVADFSDLKEVSYFSSKLTRSYLPLRVSFLNFPVFFLLGVIESYSLILFLLHIAGF